MRILICGAGIAGMTLAALLRQRGIEPDIIDRAPDFEHAGYVLGLYPLGGRVLYGLKAYPAYAEASDNLDFYNVCGSNGRLIKRFDFRPLTAEYGELRMTGRGDLLRILHEAAGKPSIRLGVTVSDAEQRGDAVLVRSSDGAECEYDLVVGADGIHSKLRERISPITHIFDSHWACYAWWTERGDYPSDHVTEQWAAGRLFGAYPTPTRLGVIACAPGDVLGHGAAEGRKARVQAAFAGLKGRSPALLASFPDDESGKVFYWKLDDRRAQIWSKGRLTLLGDAACAFLPTAGIGASMAMESAAVLAGELSRCDARSIPLALHFFEQRRRKRVEAAQDDSRRLAKLMFVRNPLFAALRNQSVRLMTVKNLGSNIVTMMGEPI